RIPYHEISVRYNTVPLPIGTKNLAQNRYGTVGNSVGTAIWQKNPPLLTYEKIIHGFVKKLDKVALNMFLGYALIELYFKCGEMGEVVKVFNRFSQPNFYFSSVKFLGASVIVLFSSSSSPPDTRKENGFSSKFLDPVECLHLGGARDGGLRFGFCSGNRFCSGHGAVLGITSEFGTKLFCLKLDMHHFQTSRGIRKSTLKWMLQSLISNVNPHSWQFSLHMVFQISFFLVSDHGQTITRWFRRFHFVEDQVSSLSSYCVPEFLTTAYNIKSNKLSCRMYLLYMLQFLVALPHPDNVRAAIIYSVFIKGQMRIELTTNNLEASKLYPDYKYTLIDKFLDICLVDPPKPKLAAF
ncbi:hypothetical protein DVH24_000582, partial [Malus domestica]